jgi:hypothetical protein
MPVTFMRSKTYGSTSETFHRTNDNVYTTLHGYNVQMTFDPLLPIGNDNENFDWTLSSSLQNVTVSDIEVMANAFTRS